MLWNSQSPSPTVRAFTTTCLESSNKAIVPDKTLTEMVHLVVALPPHDQMPRPLVAATPEFHSYVRESLL